MKSSFGDFVLQVIFIVLARNANEPLILMTIEHLKKEVENQSLFQNLKKPIIFFDIESTGLIIGEDRIIDLSYIIWDKESFYEVFEIL